MIPLDMAIKVAMDAHRRPKPPARTAPAPVQPAPAYKPMSPDTIQQIANYYAGKPISISYDNAPEGQGYSGSAVAGSAAIKLSPEVQSSLQDFMQNYGRPQSSKDIPGLATLIHEALHTRGPIGPTNTIDPNTGFYPWDDEWQARQLSYGLVSDAMKRFFGVPFDSPLGQRYYQTAASFGYTDPVKNPFGGPETPAEIAQYGQRTRPTTNPWGWFFPWATQT